MTIITVLIKLDTQQFFCKNKKCSNKSKLSIKKVYTAWCFTYWADHISQCAESFLVWGWTHLLCPQSISWVKHLQSWLHWRIKSSSWRQHSFLSSVDIHWISAHFLSTSKRVKRANVGTPLVLIWNTFPHLSVKSKSSSDMSRHFAQVCYWADLCPVENTTPLFSPLDTTALHVSSNTRLLPHWKACLSKLLYAPKII